MKNLKYTGLLAAVFVAAAGCSAPGAVDVNPATGSAESPASNTAPAAPGEIDVATFINDVQAATKALKTYHIDMNVTQVVDGESTEVAVKGKVDRSDPEKIQFDGSMSTDEMNMDLIVTKTDSYVKANGAWMKMPKANAPDMMEMLNSGTDLLLSAKDSVQSVKHVGDETIGGEAMRHYEVTITMATSVFAGLSGDSVVMDLWLDDKNFERKLEVSAEEDKDNSGAFKVSWSDINKKVTVKAPI